MNERNTQDDYYLCGNCGEMIMLEEMPENSTDKKCTNCGSDKLDFFEG